MWRVLSYFGTFRGDIAGLDAKTGEILGTAVVNGRINSSPPPTSRFSLTFHLLPMASFISAFLRRAAAAAQCYRP